MKCTHEEEDPRHPKRQARAPAPAHAASLASLDDAVWTTVIAFLAIPRFPTNAQSSELLTAWRTLLGLRLLTKELAALLHPEGNKAQWRRLMLQSFDFSVRESFNVEIDEATYFNPSILVDERAENDPQLVALRGRFHQIPPNYLEEDFVEWTKLGIYHRPSQYGFLTALQQSPPVGVWPECEDAFTLLGDLVRLLQLPDALHMPAIGCGGDFTFKYLPAPVEADSSSPFYWSYVMKALGFVPQCWHCGFGIYGESKGFTEHAFEVCIRSHGWVGVEYEDTVMFHGVGEFDFPVCSVGNAKRLYRHIRQHCRDWCFVHCRRGMPAFRVGVSKAPPHRWMGYGARIPWRR